MVSSAFFLLVVLLALFFVGVPIAFAMGATAVLGILLYLSPAQFSQLVNIAYNYASSTTMMVAPLFILMAEFMANGGVARDIYGVLSKWLRRIPGGLAVSNVLACAVFAAICGSSPVTAVTIGKISIPEMTKKGYKDTFSIGTTVASGTLGILIPPSLAFIVYGIITETSIAKLYMAGIIPGLVLAAMLSAFILIRAKLDPSLVGGRLSAASSLAGQRESREEGSFWQDVALMLPIFALIVIVLGSMYLGWVTPTEAGGIGALGALLIVWAKGRLTGAVFRTVLQETAKTTAMLILLIVGGMSFTFILSTLGIPQWMTESILGLTSNKWLILIAVYVLWLILGCLLDPTGMIVITLPFLFPTLTALGFDPIWLGVVSTITVEIGMITPPVGLNLFVVKGIVDRPFEEIVAGALPFVAVLLLALVVLTLFPQLALYLPATMK